MTDLIEMTEKQLIKTLTEWIYDRIRGGVPRVSNKECYYIFKAGYRVNGNYIEKNGEKVYRIIRHYSKRKVNLCYRQLKPELVPIDSDMNRYLEGIEKFIAEIAE